MPRYLLPFIAAAALHAGVMDFKTIDEAKKAYESGNYAKASEAYGKLHGKNDAARYNYGDALYKQKKYKEAADIFAQISDPALKQKSLYNMGNALANMGKIDDAIHAYEAALKLGEDKDARYNLELLKKQKQQQKKQQKKNQKKSKKNQQNKNSKNGQNNKDQQNQKNQQQKNQNGKNSKQNDWNKENKQDQNNQNKHDRQQNHSSQKDKRNHQPQNKQGQSASSKSAKAAQQQPANKKENDKKAQQAHAAKTQPISDMEERKYNHMLDQRGIKTLMIPLSGKGEPHENETTPW